MTSDERDSGSEPTHPDTFDEYQVTDHIAGGSYGVVFKVRSPADTEFALKWLRLDATDQGRLRFQNEIWALASLKHDVIPTLIGKGERQGRPYFVMSLARGLSLRKLLNEQRKEGGASRQMRVLSIAIQVLHALEYMHDKGIYHRDVKDDNIIATRSESNVSLVDFGFCRGNGQPADVSSFWNVGASRYSPPDKLRHPALVHPTHDVFAVGVVAYLLLTNRYPWEVSISDDVGHLEEQMRAAAPPAIKDLNSLVSKDVSTFFARLLVTQDDRRPTAAAAKQEAEELRIRLAGQLALPALTRERRIVFPRVIRDPLHGDIRMTEFEWRLLNSKECQRLRWIRQLGATHLVFPGAEHSRFSHSLGSMYVADKILRNIEDITGSLFDAEERLMARAYALVHDITHISYGHTLEDELALYVRHDSNDPRFNRLLLSDTSETGNILRSTDYGREVLAHLDSASTIVRHTHIKELIEGPTGADVLDYIDRDAYFCGLDHRVDTAIFRRYRVIAPPSGTADERHMAARLYGTHGVRLDAEFALESILRERFALFLKIYTHPAKIAAGAMLGKAMGHATRSGDKPEFDEPALEWMGDNELLARLRSSRRQGCRDMAELFAARQLFKPAFRAPALPTDERDMVEQYSVRLQQFRDKGLLEPEGRTLAENALAKKAGMKPLEVIVYCSPKAPGFQKVRQYVEDQPGCTELRDDVHRPYLRTLKRHLGLWTAYVFTSAKRGDPRRDRIGEAAEALFGMRNQIATNRRQELLF